MELPRGALEPRSRTEYPMFTLGTIGGVSAVPRWITLARDHPRLLEPVVNRYRFGLPTIGTYLRDLGAAFEYWPALKARTADWAAETLQPLAVANSLGEPFAQWLGTSVREWAEQFQEAYNSSKHLIKSSKANEENFEVLAMVGAVVLTAVALQEVSTADWTVQSLLESHHLTGVQRLARETLA